MFQLVLVVLPLLCEAARVHVQDDQDLSSKDRDHVQNVFSKASRFVVPSKHGSVSNSVLQEGSEQRAQYHKFEGGADMGSLKAEFADGGAACWGNRSAPVTILTLAAGLSDTYMSLLRKNRLAYAAQHGLEYCEYTHVLDPKRELTWSKIWAILYLLEDPNGPRSRVQWLDADVLIMNSNISIVPDLLGPLASKDAVFSADFPAARGEVDVKSQLNAGSMHLRNSNWTRTMLHHLFTTAAGTRSTALALLDSHYDCEQTALMQMRAENPKEFAAHTAMVPWNVMNTLGISNYCDGDFVVHAAGGGNRLESFFTGHYWPKWGGSDKYEQLQEFMLHREAQKAVQHLRGEPMGSQPRCGEFVPGVEKSMWYFVLVRGAFILIALGGLLMALWRITWLAVVELQRGAGLLGRKARDDASETSETVASR